MYKINKTTNNLEKLDQKLFKELKIRERDHLQEWIAKNPQILGEELLIIQKEYDGFNDTNERLDLLALDKKGNLVIIENKLDDTGKDVVWQALKYTSYCSTLTTNQIIKIYQSYLDKWQNGEDSLQNLLDFLDNNEEELLLNKDDQRMMFVANNYRKEVTSTVLWLLNHDIQVQCFRAIPYSMEDNIFLQIEQIIPLPETKEYMIDAKEKVKEINIKSKTVSESEARLIKFWGLLKIKLKENNLDYLDNISPKKYYDIGFSKGSGYYGFCIGRKGFRVELYISNDPDKSYIDAMIKHKDLISNSFSNSIEFQRLENKRASRICYYLPKTEQNKFVGKFNDEIYWDDLLEWYKDSMREFLNSIDPIWEKVKKELN